jgi:ABC-2 type transport system permease protein
VTEVFRVAYKEVLRRRRDPFAIIIWLLIPLSLAGIFALIFGGMGADGGVPRASLLVADEDDSFVSRLLVGSLSSSQVGNFIEPESVDEEKGIDMMMEGKASALLVIPEGFGEAYLEGSPTTLRLIKNPMQRILPSICQSVVETLLEMGSVARSVFDSPIRSITGMVEAQQDPTQSELDAMSVRMGRTMQTVMPYVYPTLVSLDVESIEREASADELDFAAAYYPGLVLMALLFITVGLSQDVWREKRHGALARCIMSPVSLFNFFVGKLIGALVICTLVLVVMLVAGSLLFDLTWHHLWAVVLLGLCVSACLLAVFSVLVLALSRNERTSNVVTDVLLMALMLTSGTTVPLEAMPAGMVKMASFTPLGHVLLIYKDLLKGELPLALVLGTAGAYVLISAVFGIIAGWKFFPRFARR